jgi:hypothetical protein
MIQLASKPVDISIKKGISADTWSLAVHPSDLGDRAFHADSLSQA